MNEKTKNMLSHLKGNGQEASNTLLDRSKKLLKNIDFKSPKTATVAGAVGLVAAAGVAYYLMRRK